MVEAFAPRKRKEVWRKLDIYPTGTVHEEQNCVASSLTNVDGDYVSLAVKALRLGLATIYNSQIGLEMVQDIIFGTPAPHEVNTDLGIFDPDYINIVFNGHQPWIGALTIEKLRSPGYQEMGRAAGAKGIRVIGSIETGQELLQRYPMDEVFVGLMGNWLAIEPMLATGAVDVLAMEENCSPPAIDSYAEKYQVALVAISTIIGVPGIQDKIPYNPEKADEMSEKIIGIGIENFKKRHNKISPHVPGRIQKAIAGFSIEAVLGALGNKLDPLVDVIAAGKIKGVVALADHLDVDIPQLPIAVTAPEWMEQKATIDGIFAVAYGAYTHLSPTPFVSGAPRLIKLLTEDVEKLTGGKVALGDDPIEAANGIEAHILARRKGLGLS